MAAYNKFYIFVQDVGRKVHNLNSDSLKVMLTNTAPVATNTIDGNITEISAGNGYSAGGNTPTNSGYSQTTGVGKLILVDTVFTASGGSIGPFRYAVLYNNTAGSASNRPLIAWYDYGSSISLNDGETLTIDFDGTNGVFTIT